MKTILLALFSFLFGNSIYLLMSETLLLGYAQTVGILLLGMFTVYWNNRRKKDVADVKDKVVSVKDEVTNVKDELSKVHIKIDGMRENELKITKELGEATGAETGRQLNRTETREDKIDKANI